MANRTKEEIEMENEIMRKILFPCKTCNGRGELDDAEPGDICMNIWECPDCGGFNVREAKKALDV